MQQLFALLIIVGLTKINGNPGDFRPPAVPLIVFSPHVSGKSQCATSVRKKKKDFSSHHCQNEPANLLFLQE